MNGTEEEKEKREKKSLGVNGGRGTTVVNGDQSQKNAKLKKRE